MVPLDFCHFAFVQHIGAETKWLTFSRRRFQMNFLEWKYLISKTIWLKFVPKNPINNKTILVQIIVGAEQETSHYPNQWWSRSVTPICVTLPQWFHIIYSFSSSIVSPNNTQATGLFDFPHKGNSNLMPSVTKLARYHLLLGIIFSPVCEACPFARHNRLGFI